MKNYIYTKKPSEEVSNAVEVAISVIINVENNPYDYVEIANALKILAIECGNLRSYIEKTEYKRKK